MKPSAFDFLDFSYVPSRWKLWVDVLHNYVWGRWMEMKAVQLLFYNLALKLGSLKGRDEDKLWVNKATTLNNQKRGHF